MTELIQELGGHGLAAIYAFAEPGPTVLLRRELDALPIQKTNTADYRSRTDGVAHLRGHDGHLAPVRRQNTGGRLSVTPWTGWSRRSAGP